MNRDEIRKHLSGLICSLSTPFSKDGDIDYDGLRNLNDEDMERLKSFFQENKLL